MLTVLTSGQAVTVQGAQPSSVATDSPPLDAPTPDFKHHGNAWAHGGKQDERWGDYGGRGDRELPLPTQLPALTAPASAATSCSSSLVLQASSHVDSSMPTMQSSTFQDSSPSPSVSLAVPTYSDPPVESMQQSVDDSIPVANSSPTSTVANPSAISTGSSPGASNQSGGSAADWAQAPNSQGVNILAAANKLRKAWM